MYKLFVIIILTSFSIIRLCAQDDIDSELRNHPYFINNQNKIKDSFYKFACKDESIILSDIENSVFPEYFSSKISSIINSDECYIEIDSINIASSQIKIDYKQNMSFNYPDLCKDE